MSNLHKTARRLRTINRKILRGSRNRRHCKRLYRLQQRAEYAWFYAYRAQEGRKNKPRVPSTPEPREEA